MKFPAYVVMGSTTIRKYTPYLLIVATVLGVAFLTTGVQYLYMSEMDYFPQHSAFADYFRKLFYDTHDFFPSFAFHIGAGQNIYNFSYYGLYNPVILPSYLLPFVPMTYYLITVNLGLQIFSGVLVYRLLRKLNFRNALLLTLLFILAASLTFQAHRQFMFVSYMPFLLMTLFGVEKYLARKKSWLYLLGIFLMIMTSFYFTISCVLVVVLYYCYRYYQMHQSFPLKQGLRFVLPMLIPLAMSLVLLIPTFLVIFQNRLPCPNEVTGWLQLSIPRFQLDGLVYSPYGMGLTGLFFIALFDNLWNKEKQIRLLSIIMILLLVLPILLFLLNGTLYVEPKVLIPFLPLMLLLGEETINHFQKKRILPLLGITLIVCLISAPPHWLIRVGILADAIFTICILYWKDKKGKHAINYAFLIVALAVCIGVSHFDDMVPVSNYHEARDADSSVCAFARQEDNVDENKEDNTNFIPNIRYFSDAVYGSLYNLNYADFFVNVMNNPYSYRNRAIFNSTDNIMMETIMGVKYVKTLHPGVGYKHYRDKIYSNSNVLPLGYVNSRMVSSDSFEQLPQVYKADVLINGIVTDTGKKPAVSNIKKVRLPYEVLEQRGLKISGNVVKAEEENVLKLRVKRNMENQILFINIKLQINSGKEKYPLILTKNNRDDKDLDITINGVPNKQTGPGWRYDNENNKNGLGYVLSNIRDGELEIQFSPGTYQIKKVDTYLLDYNSISTINEKIDPFHIERISGDIMEGQIQVTKDGYFIMQIPYDENFKVFVNNKPKQYEKVNHDFIGFPLSEGNYNIRLEYEAPGLKAGMGLSAFGFICFLLLIVLETKKANHLLSKKR